MEEYNIAITDQKMLFSIKNSKIDNKYNMIYSFGDGEIEQSDLTISIDTSNSEIASVNCYKKEAIVKHEIIMDEDKTKLERFPIPFYLLPTDYEYAPLTEIDNFFIHYSKDKMRVIFRNGTVNSYFENGRLDFYYDEDKNLLYFDVNDLTDEEFEVLENHKKKQTEKNGIRK